MLQFDEYKVKLNNLRPELDELDQALGLETAIREVEMLESESASDGFWDNLEKVVDFCTRTAGACAVFPEVVFFAQFYDSVPRQTYHIMPDFACFIVFFVNGYVQSVFGDFQYFCYEFPRPRHDFVFEVITEGEVAQHFKECAVTSGFPYVVDITCTDTFLAGCHSLAGRDFLTSKVCFHGCHTRVDQQQAVDVLRPLVGKG